MTSRKQLKQYARKFPLGKLVRSRAGKTPSRGNPEFWGGTIPWLSAKDLKTFRVSTSIERITAEAVENGAPLSQPGDILILVRGMTLLKNVPIALTEGRVSFNQDVRCLHPREEVSGEYLAHLLTGSRGHLLSLVTHAGHGTGRLESEQLSEWLLPVPPRGVQDWLAARLRPVDQSLELLSELIAAKRTFKRALMQELLTGRRQFGEFSATQRKGWRRVRLGSIAFEVKERAGDTSPPVLSCTKHDGLVLSEEYFGKQVFSRDLSSYKVVRRGQFAYATNHLEEGSIGLLVDSDAGLVSPMYTVFEVGCAETIPEYLYALLKSGPFISLFRRLTSGSVNRRGALRWSTLRQVEVLLPPRQEQLRIVGLVENLDREIAGLDRLAGGYQSLKRGLMQRLLSGDLDLPDALVAGAAAATPDAGESDDDS